MSYGKYLNMANLEKRKVWSKLVLRSKTISERLYVVGAPHFYDLFQKAEFGPIV